MVNRLEAAATAYQQAQQAEADTKTRAMARAKAEIAVAQGRTAEARQRLAAEIVAAAESGMRQADIVRATGYNREHVRRILRAAGI